MRGMVVGDGGRSSGVLLYKQWLSNSNPPGCQWRASKVEPVLDQSQCQLKLNGMGGDMGIQPIGINHKAANMAITYYHIK